MRILLLSFFLLLLTSSLYSQCTHTLQLTDTYGDGWNGGAVSLSVNGVTVISNATFNSGFGPAVGNFTASSGQTIRVWRTYAGSWPSEMRIRVINSSGTVIINTIQPTTGTATSGGAAGLASCVAVTPPSNDLVCNATSISCGQTIAGTTVNATNSGTGEMISCGVSQSNPGVWYKVVGNGQYMTVSLCATVWDSKISVFSGSCSSLSCMGGNDDFGPACSSSSASYQWLSVTGVTYWVLVHGYSTNSAFNIALNCVAPPTPGPCTNTTAYGTQNMPVLGGAPYESIFCQYAGEYSTWFNSIANTPYTVTSSNPLDWITIRRGSSNGLVVSTGTAIVNFIPPVTGTIYIHVNFNSYCATQTTCRDITMSRGSALPIELLYFEGRKNGNSNYIEWSTASEHNSSHFVVEKSEDGYVWNPIGQLPSAINSTQELHYDITDNNVSPVYNYYRLKQFDIDGVNKEYGPIVINNKTQSKTIAKRINLIGQEVDENEKGIIIEIYEDGTLKRTIK